MVMTNTDDFDLWYREQYKPVLAAVMMLCGSDHARAEDAVNDAFVKALERWLQVREMESPGGWVTRVALNNAKRSLRLRGRRIRRLHADEEAVEDRTINSDLWRAVHKLPQRQRQAVILRYVEDLSQEQVARELGIAPGTAAAALNQARKNLRHSPIVELGDQND